MGADRVSDGTDTNAETVEEQPDRRPPPPPDKPGTDGYPSRADSRQGAAAANDTSTQDTENQGEDKPDTSQASQEAAGERDSTSSEKPETPGPTEPNESIGNDGGSTDGRHATGSEVGTGGRLEIGQHPEQTIDDGGREQAPDGTAVRQDNPGTVEMEERSAPADAPGARPDSAAGEGPTAEVAEPASVDTSSARNPADVAGEARTDAELVGGVSEAGAPAGMGEGQPRAADISRPDQPDEALAAADAGSGDKPDAEQGSDALQEKTQTGEAAEEPGTTLGESAETLGQRLERSGNEAEPGADDAAGGIDADRKRPLGDRLMVGDVPLREYLNSRDGAAAGSDVVGEPWTDPTADLPPTGKELVEMDNDKLSRFERFRKEGHKELTDALDVTEKGFDLGVGAFARPPTHAETRTSQPEVVEAPHHAVTAGEAAAGLLAAGVLMSELVRWGHGKLTPEKRRS
jgi:hypothetical protein